MDKPLDILYIDNHLIVVNKPAGLLVQGDSSGDKTLLEQAKRYLKSTYQKPGDVFLGLVHRLDKPVSGIVVFARTSKGAARISEQIRNHQFKKSYMALVEGKVPIEGQLIDHLDRKNRRALVVSPKQGKYSELSFKRTSHRAGISVVEIDLKTGRYHQIRAQFSARGFPILGDKKYGAEQGGGRVGIALHACSTSFFHPVRNELLTIQAQMHERWADGLI